MKKNVKETNGMNQNSQTALETFSKRPCRRVLPRCKWTLRWIPKTRIQRLLVEALATEYKELEVFLEGKLSYALAKQDTDLQKKQLVSQTISESQSTKKQKKEMYRESKKEKAREKKTQENAAKKAADIQSATEAFNITVLRCYEIYEYTMAYLPQCKPMDKTGEIFDLHEELLKVKNSFSKMHNELTKGV